MLGMPVVGDANQQIRQSPRFHQRVLQVGQRDADDLPLHCRRTQARIGALAFADLERQRRRVAP